MSKLLLKVGAFALVAVALFGLFINPYTTKADEGVMVGLFQVIVVAWALLSAFLYQRADEEWKKVQTAVLANDPDTFLVEVPKRIPKTFQTLYGVVSGIAVVSAMGFHLDSLFIFLFLGLFNFVVGFMYLIIKDLDDPIAGVVNVEGIPREWLQKLSNPKK